MPITAAVLTRKPVIRAAYQICRQAIYTVIGEVAEKVRPGIGGLRFRAQERVSLASPIKRVVDEPG